MHTATDSELVERQKLSRMQFFHLNSLLDNASLQRLISMLILSTFLSFNSMHVAQFTHRTPNSNPEPVELTFVFKPVRTHIKLILHGHGVSEPSLKVLIQDITALGDSVQEHVHCHEAKSFTVHLESVRSDASQVEDLGRPLQPPCNILSTPAPWIRCVSKRCSFLIREHIQTVILKPWNVSWSCSVKMK